MQDSLTPLPAVHSTLGALFLGNNAAAIFYGITTVQTFTYYKNSRGDSPRFKWLIYTLWVVDTLHLIFIVLNLYHYAIANFTQLDALLAPSWSLMAIIFTTAFSDFIVRGIFSHRIWLLSGKKIVYVVVITVPSIMTLLAAIFCASRMFSFNTFEDFPKVSPPLFVGLVSALAADLSITASLVWLLLNTHTRFKQTDSLINTLMVYAINTGLISMICRAMCLVTYVIRPKAMIFIGIYFVLSELSLNSLLATLNARKSLREGSNNAYARPLNLRASAQDEFTGSKPRLVIHVDEDTTRSDTTQSIKPVGQ